MGARGIGGVGIVVVAAFALVGCSVFGSGTTARPGPHERNAHASTSPSEPAAGGTAAPGGPAAPGGTAAPDTTVDEQLPAPLASGTVVAETEVTSPSGDTAIHVRVVSDGDRTFTAQLSGYRSTVSQPMSLEFRAGVAQPGDGYDANAVGRVQWSAGDLPEPSDDLRTAGFDPSFLQSVVLVPLATTDQVNAGTPPPWSGHVLATAHLTWHVPSPFPGFHLGTIAAAKPYAFGQLIRDQAGAPVQYLVAHGDRGVDVAKRLGISLAALEWLNPPSAFHEHDWLGEGDRLNLDPAARSTATSGFNS